jgi:nucleoid DNA-binding protein
MPPEDRDYLVHVVAARTGLTQDEAQKRVDQVTAEIKDAADKARKSAAAFSLFGAFSMLIGAFIASVAAAIGGRQRDEHPA